jgi:hypothetical protein
VVLRLSLLASSKSLLGFELGGWASGRGELHPPALSETGRDSLPSTGSHHPARLIVRRIAFAASSETARQKLTNNAPAPVHG